MTTTDGLSGVMSGSNSGSNTDGPVRSFSTVIRYAEGEGVRQWTSADELAGSEKSQDRQRQLAWPLSVNRSPDFDSCRLPDHRWASNARLLGRINRLTSRHRDYGGHP